MKWIKLFEDFKNNNEHNRVSVGNMQKRLKSSTKVEQRDFNCKRFEEENPFYINAQIG